VFCPSGFGGRQPGLTNGRVRTGLCCHLVQLERGRSEKHRHRIFQAWVSGSVPLDGDFVTLCFLAWDLVRKSLAELQGRRRRLAPGEHYRFGPFADAGVEARRQLFASSDLPLVDVLAFLASREQRDLVSIEDRPLSLEGRAEIASPSLMVLAPCPRAL
jgi:hypothetical protein